MPDNKPIDELFIEIDATDKKANISIDNICKSLEKLNSTIGNLDKIENLTKNINSLMTPFTKIKGQTNNLSEFVKGLKKLNKIDGIETVTNNINKIYSSISKFSNIPPEINNTIQSLANLASSAEKVKASTKGIAQDKVLPEQPSGNAPTSADSTIESTSTKFQVFKDKIKSFFTDETDFVNFGTKIANIGNSFAKVGSAISGAFQKIKQFGSQVWKTLGKIPGKVKSITNGFKELVKKIIPASEQMESFSGTFKKLFSRIAVMGLLRRAFSQALSAMKEGIKNVAQSVDSYNNSMSTIATSTNYLKNSLAASLAPALNAIAPIIDKITDKFVSFIEIFSQVVAKITGQSTFVKARKTQVNYAESLDGTSSSAKKASDSVKEYQKTISSFDEANLIKTKSETSATGSSGSSGGGYAFDEAKVADTGIVGKIGETIDEIKAAFNRGDYYEAGKIFADRINEVIAKVNSFDWIGVQNKISDFVHSVATSINGAVENIDWNSFGILLANIYNTASTAIVDFTHTINFDSFGAALANGLNGLLEAIDVKNVASLLMEKFTIITDFVYGFVTNFDFAQFGLKISETLKAAFDLINFDELVGIINKGLTGVLDTLITFFDDIDLAGAINEINNALSKIEWSEIGEKLAELLQSIDWVGIFNSLIHTIDELLGGLINFVTGFIEGMDWTKAMQDLFDMIGGLWENIDWGKLTKDISELLGAAIGAAFNLLAVGTAEIEEFFLSINDAIVSYFDKYFDWGDSPENIIKGLFQGITDAFVNVATWIYDNMIKPFVDGVKKGFGIHSPSTVMAEIGGYLIDGLKNGIGDVWKKIKEKFETFKQRTTSWFNSSTNNFKSFGSNIVTNIKNGIGDIWGSVKEKFSKFINDIRDFFRGKSLFKINVDWDTTSFAGKALSKAGLPGLPKLSFYEKGGFLNYGELAVVRENGMPEMVGRIGNRPAVANNDQIVASVTNGVRIGVQDAFSYLLPTFQSGMGGGRTTNINLKVDKQILASLVYDVNADVVRRKPAY